MENNLPLWNFIYMIAPMEAWQSGLMHRSGKPTRARVLREFESHRFRQIQKTPIIDWGFLLPSFFIDIDSVNKSKRQCTC